MRDYPERMVFFDTETVEHPSERTGWQRDLTLRVGVAKVYDPLSGRGAEPVYHVFKTPGAFHELIASMPLSKTKIHIFAHNIGFDTRIVEWFSWASMGYYALYPPPESKDAYRFKNPLFNIDGTPTMMRYFRRDGQQIMLLDSFNWYDTALEKVGEWIGVKKGKMPRDDDTDADWEDYCRQDVDVLDAAMQRLWGWLQSMRLPDFHPSPAAQAQQIYRMRYARKRVIVPEDPSPLSLDRHGYYGGRLECYRVGRIEGMTYQLDVNSLYPAVMYLNPYPCEIVDHDHRPGARASVGSIDSRVTTAEVWIDSDESPWPVRCRDGTAWVRGKVRTILCGPELDRAIGQGVVKRIGRWTQYRLDNLFEEFVSFFWRMRIRAERQGDPMVSRFCKRILNSLHGKFGQRDGDWVDLGERLDRSAFGGGYVIGHGVMPDTEWRALGGRYFERLRDQEGDQSFVPIAAWCASYGRVYMEDIMDRVGRDSVLYINTDSIVVDGDGLGRLQLDDLVEDGKLGHFKVEAVREWVDIKGLNQLEWDGGYKHGGVKAGLVPSADGVVSYTEFDSLSNAIKSGKPSYVSIRTALRSLRGSYTRGVISADGKTAPYIVSLWDRTPEEIRLLRMSELGGRGEQ